jgi:excisionase family DNA binding protein
LNVNAIKPTSAPGSARAASPPPGQVTLDEVVRLLHELKGGLEEVQATLQTRRKSHYTVEEVAEMTGRTAFTVRRWISEHRIRATRISGTGPRGRLLIPREELDLLISAGRGAHVPDAVVGL